MLNIAKCKLCSSVIQSFHSTDYVLCKCGEIYVDGGPGMACGARDWNNFLRVDDKGNEIVVTVKEKKEKDGDYAPLKNRSELISYFDEMIKSYENLPDHAMKAPISHYDMCSVLLLISAILKSEN